ncbi:MAG: hypothetical protein FK733_01030 [Asgard group archaeon]|nr:hypothetical protein [Asgard group archaeon]
MKQCVVCKATIESGQYCDAHLIAKKNLEERYQDWVTAFGKLTWEDYLTKLFEDESIPVGDWAREVANYLLKKGTKKK